MRAVVLTAHGGPENLEYVTDYPDPTPGPGEVLVKIGASSLNYHDVFTRRGMPGIRVPLPVVPGLDIAGEVAALGPGVEGVAIGARVLIDPIYPGVGLMGEMRDGGLAEYCVASAGQLVAIPDGVSFAEAAAIPVAYGTAHRMLTTNGPIEPGQKVLILGASGGVGTASVLLAKLAGAEVIAAAGSAEKLARLKALGAHEVDVDVGDSTGTTGTHPAAGHGDLDLDLDVGAATGSHGRNGGTLDLDVGTATVPDTAFAATQRLSTEDLALPDLEPVTMSEVGTKLDLARAYMDMGDPDGARNILEEVISEGSAAQKQEAQRLMESLPG